MRLAALCAGSGAGLAADAVIRMCNGHDFIAHVIAKLIFSFKGLFY
jgi:hypothetical protein